MTLFYIKIWPMHLIISCALGVLVRFLYDTMHLIKLNALLIKDRRKHSVFIWMQDNFNTCLPRKNVFIRIKYNPPPQNKTSAKKKHYTINFIHLINKVHHILSAFTNQCTGSIFMVSAFIFLTPTPNMPILFTAIPHHHHQQSHPLHWIYSTS